MLNSIKNHDETGCKISSVYIYIYIVLYTYNCIIIFTVDCMYIMLKGKQMCNITILQYYKWLYI